MCGRYALDADIDELIERYKAIVAEREAGSSKEIFPTNTQAIVVDGNGREIKAAVWGFAPHFAKRPLINARGETVHQKPTFRQAFHTGRCIVPATSFFEWEKVDDKKIKRRISVEDAKIFSMAGLVSIFKDKEGNPFEAYTIITTAANEQMNSIHDRMPVILDGNKEGLWLDNRYKDIEEIKNLLLPTELKLRID
ncbi:SOS response-associated peptidase [Gudongella sp. DL1XJH-153]|uniref:SOS response-associated peptidase n=1 Tax=Gudongella sp. DL1XJH-153 TaxID=3409804 RepID=UPI003BB4E918